MNENEMTAFDRLLPQDVEAERSLLGSVMVDSERLPDVEAVLTAGAAEFVRPEHAVLYDALRELDRDGVKPDGEVLRDRLTRLGKWESIGKFDGLGAMLARAPSASRATDYAELVHARYVERELYMAGYRIMELAADGAQPVPDRVAQAERMIGRINEGAQRDFARPIGEILAEFWEDVEQGRSVGLETQWSEYNAKIGGLQRAEFVVVAARPSIGKSAFLLNLADYTALTREAPVLFFSLEMSDKDCLGRILSGRSGVALRTLKTGALTPAQQDAVDSALALLDRGREKLLLDATPYLTTSDISARARIAKRRSGIALVCVDYLQMIRCAVACESRQVEVTRISQELKALAKDLDVPVVVAAQLNRKPTERADQRPRMSDLRESGSIEMDADQIILLHRERAVEIQREGYVETMPADETEVVVAKNRNGPTGEFKLRWRPEAMRFDNFVPNALGDYAR